jgi:hypothetical protein
MHSIFLVKSGVIGAGGLGGAKHRSTFVKVVEGPLIYNFADCIVHFSSGFWSFSHSNRAKRNGIGAAPRRRVRARAHGHAATAASASGTPTRPKDQSINT